MRRRDLVLSPLLAAGARPLAAQGVQPFGEQGGFELLGDWTFGTRRRDATIRSKWQLDEKFYYRYIYDRGEKDKIRTYWSYHRDYPEGDARSLHVFGPRSLTLKGRIPPGGGLRQRGIESGMLRAKLPVTPGCYVEMRARLPRGIGTWPAFWLNPGVQRANGTFSALPWPPEIDIFEFFNWQGRPRPMVMEGNVATDKRPADFGNPHDLFTLFRRREYRTGADMSADFHVYALDWVEDRPIWLLDGRKIKQTYYEWRDAPPAHVLVTNQIGIALPGADMSEMVADESNWDFEIEWIRVWRRR